MKVVYTLRDDAVALREMQSKSQSAETTEQGIPQGPIGSNGWWAEIEKGMLETHLMEGAISGFWPEQAGRNPAEFELWPARGPRVVWPCGLKGRVAQNEFRIGRTVEVRYVKQRLEEAEEAKIVLSIALE